MKFASFLFPESRDPSWDSTIIGETIEEAKLAEKLGFDAVFLAEHHFDGNCAYVDPPVFAAALAMVTQRIRIGFAVLQTSLYHPLHLAEQLALLDILSQGRLIVGLGRGSLFNTHEYTGFEIDPKQAQDRFEEIEKILIQCWAGGHVEHRGRFWNFEIPGLRPRPLSRPLPELLRSVASEASLIAQAKRGRPVLLAVPENSATTRMADLFGNTMMEAGFGAPAIRDVMARSWLSRHILVADTDQEAEMSRTYFDQMQVYRSAQSSAFQERVNKPASTTVPPLVLLGSPDTVIKELLPLTQTGIGGLIVRFRFGPMPAQTSNKSIHLFMKHVAPVLRQRSMEQATQA